jgi:monofunctional glycosyltransferase
VRDTAAAKPARSKARVRKARSVRRGGGFWGFVKRLITALAIVLLVVPPAAVAVYKFVPPPVTILMIERLIQGHGMDYRWRPLSEMSRALPQAAVASEDELFCSNHGFDFEAMEKALRHNERDPNRIRGGSTISQQTAKNVFLWPGRDYVRKAIEAWYTVLIEAIWGKPRIMETYLNVVEFGPGVYGAEAASERFFHVHAAQLSPAQAARLIAVLPKPLKWDAAAPGRYVARRSGHIGRAMGAVRSDDLAGCVGR